MVSDDLDDSGTVNTMEELQNLTLNLLYHLEISVPSDRIEQWHATVLVNPAGEMDEANYQSWFLATFSDLVETY